MQLLMHRLLARAQEADLVVSLSECEEALRMTSNRIDEALTLMQQKVGCDSVSGSANCIYCEELIASVANLCVPV